MDELRIRTGFMKRLIGKIIENNISKIIGYNCTAKIDELSVCNTGPTSNVHLDIQLEVNTEDIPKILKKIGVM